MHIVFPIEYIVSNFKQYWLDGTLKLTATMNKWSRNDKIAFASLTIAILMIVVTLLIPELRQIVGLESYHKPTVEEIKPVPKPQKTIPPNKPKQQPPSSTPKQLAKGGTKPEESNHVQIPDLSASDSKNRISLLGKQNQDLQAEVSNPNKTTEIPQVRFEYTNNKLSLIDGEKRKELFTNYKLYEYSLSKSRKKIAVIAAEERWRYYFIIVSNVDRDLFDSSVWEINLAGYGPPKNLKWVSDTVLRVYLESSDTIKFDNILLKGTGTYDITVDEINSLLGIKEFKIGG